MGVDVRGSGSTEQRELGFLELFAGLVLLACLLGTVRWRVFPLELFSHFRLQYFWLALGCAVLFAAKRRPFAAFTALGLVLCHGFALAPYYSLAAPSSSTASADKPKLRILFGNLFAENDRVGEVVTLARSLNVDMISLSEVIPSAAEALTPLATEFPYHAVAAKHLPASPVLFSKVPFENSKFNEQVLQAESDVALGAQTISVFDLPSTPPITKELLRRRDESLNYLSGRIQTRTKPILVLADLNTSPWSAAFREMIASSGLRDAREGRGVFASWPTYLWPLRIPIDYCLTTMELEVTEFRPIPIPGSDHLGFICEVTLKGAPPTPKAEN